MTTAAQKAELNRATSAHALLAFITISHPTLPGGALRYVTDVLDYVWNGNTFTAIGGVEPPLADDGDTEPRIRVTIPNIDRRIGQTLQKAGSRLAFSLDLLSSADFDLSVDPRTAIGTPTPFYSMSQFETTGAQFDDVAAEVTLILRDFAQEPYGLYASPELMPGVYR